jgi:hypothetical protein
LVRAARSGALCSVGCALDGKRVLYLAFNRDIAREGDLVFPLTTKDATGAAPRRVWLRPIPPVVVGAPSVLNRVLGGELSDL